MAKGSKKKNKKGGRGKLRGEGPAIGATSYSGPCIARKFSADEMTYTIMLRYIFPVSTGVGVTTFATVFANDPTGAVEWSSLSSLFDTYRVLAMELKYIPASYTGTLLTGGTLLCVMDYNDTTALASQAAALQYDSVAFRNIGTTTSPVEVGWTYGPWRAKGAGLMGWNNVTGGPPVGQVGSIKVYSSSLTASTGYGAIVLFWLVQLRGRQ